MRVAVTGAAGFLGGHLCDALRTRGDEVVPLVRARSKGEAAGARTVEEAITAPEILASTDALVHCAAVRDRHGVDARTYHASNVGLVERLLHACAGRVRRFVYVSSVGVYGFPSRLPVTEAHPFAPVTRYAETKVAAEALVRSLAPALGVQWVIVRPTIVYGPRDTHGMLDKLARMIRQGTYLVVGDGQNTLHHTHVDDVVAGLLLACEVPSAASEDFVLAGPETTTLAALSTAVALALGRTVPRLRVPLGVARAAASVVDSAVRRRVLFTAREPPITHHKLDVMCRSIAFDTSKAERILGYRPAVSYAQGIPRTLWPPASAP